MIRAFSILLSAAALMSTSSEAWCANDEAQAASPASDASVSPSIDQTAPAPFSGKAIDDVELRAIAGREDTTQVSQSEQFAGVASNSVGDNSVTGDARIADNAFQNMSGLSILNVNTGNNVAINASMNVNVSISPGQ